MAGIDAGFWVCGDCRSVNRRGARRCYQCRTPRDIAAVDPSEIEGTGHGRLREIALPEFRPTRWAAVVASVLLILVAVMQVVSTVSDAILFDRIVRNPALLTDPAFARSVESMVAGTAAVAASAVALLALVAWSFWLSRAVMAMPALGLGYPAANGLMAFVENFLPGLNLFRVPAIVRDVMRRLEPESLWREALIFAAWIGLLGGYLAPRFGAYLGLLGSGTLEEIVQQTLLVQAIATALVVVGATFLVALIWWIERRIERRRAAQLAGELPSEASVAGTAPASEPGLHAASSGAPAVPGQAPLGAESESAELAAASVSSATASDAPVAEDALAGPSGTIAARAESSRFASRSIMAATGVGSIPPELSMAGRAPEAPTEATMQMPTSATTVDEAPLAEQAHAPVGDSAIEAGASLEAPERPVQHTPPTTEQPTVAEEPPRAEPEPPAGSERRPAEPRPPAGSERPPAGSERPPAQPSPADSTAAEPEPPGGTGTGPQLHLRIESVSSMIATMDGESEPITLDDLRAAAQALARANGSAVIATGGTSFGALSLAEQAFEVLSDAQVPTSVEE